MNELKVFQDTLMPILKASTPVITGNLKTHTKWVNGKEYIQISGAKSNLRPELPTGFNYAYLVNAGRGWGGMKRYHYVEKAIEKASIASGIKCQITYRGRIGEDIYVII